MGEKVKLSARVRPDCEVGRWVYEEILGLEAQLAAKTAECERLMKELADAKDDADYIMADEVRRENKLYRARVEEILALDDIEYPDGDENVVSAVNDALEHLRNERDEARREMCERGCIWEDGLAVQMMGRHAKAAAYARGWSYLYDEAGGR